MSSQEWTNHLLWVTHAAVVAVTASLVNREVPEPYMVSAGRNEQARHERSPDVECSCYIRMRSFTLVKPRRIAPVAGCNGTLSSLPLLDCPFPAFEMHREQID